MSAFWDFSVRVYDAPGVKPACLALQSAGLDVNTALWIVWTALEERDPLDRLDQAMAISTEWSGAVTAPLRAARDALKLAPGFVDEAAAKALRRRILEVELEAERLEQAALEALTGQCVRLAKDGAPRAAALLALQAYARRAGPGAAAQGFMDTVFSAAENR